MDVTNPVLRAKYTFFLTILANELSMLVTTGYDAARELDATLLVGQLFAVTVLHVKDDLTFFIRPPARVGSWSSDVNACARNYVIVTNLYEWVGRVEECTEHKAMLDSKLFQQGNTTPEEIVMIKRVQDSAAETKYK